MDAFRHRRTFVQARRGAIALPSAPFDPLDPFGIHKSTAPASSTASASSASVSASSSAATSTSGSASASVSASASASASVPSPSAPSSDPTPTPSPTPYPGPGTDSTPPPTSLSTGPPATVTAFTTVGAAPTSAIPSTSPSAAADDAPPTGFLQNKVLSGIVFGVVGLIGLTLIIFVATWMLRRSRNKRLVNEAISFDPVNYGKDEYPEDIIEKGRSGNTTAGAGAGALGAATISNSGHDVRSLRSVGSYATGSASHGAPPISQAPAFADYIPPVPYLNSAPSTPRSQQQFSEQQNQTPNIRGNSVYNPYVGAGFGQTLPPQQQAFPPPYYTQQPGPRPQSSLGCDYGNSVGVEGEHARRSSSSMELKFASPDSGRK